MSDWNPSLYLHFAAERSRPAVELLARVSLENIEYIADLGCGPGNSTALLHQRWPAARITGIDSSPAMIAEARSALPDCLFVEADIRNWQPEQALDLMYDAKSGCRQRELACRQCARSLPELLKYH
ncbi:trans-aconitate 2-methyltransferase [Escherichia coli UMEA 3662-1]|nr:trans-aconitate 2-methyltransferase [Escherichia coli UMEA 3662-1]